MLYGVVWYGIIIMEECDFMKLWYDRKAKDPTYFVQIGIRNGKKVTTRNIERIGKHSVLLKDHDDPLQYAKDYVRSLNENIRKEKVDINLTVSLSEKLKNNGDEISKSLERNVGYFYIKNIYEKLGMKEFFDKLTQGRKISFDMNAINLILTASRIIDPGSKLYTHAHLQRYYGSYSFDYQHIHRFMEEIYDHYDEYIETLFDNSNNIRQRDTSVCYFDCTNFYFEKEEEDEDYYDEVTGELIRGLLKYGVSKEHRPNPIVQMGLFMDGDGIPLSMCINSGSDNESLCAVPAEEKLLRMFRNKSIIYCSDAGLGYSNTRLYNDMSGRKFIVTQSVKKLSDAYKEALFNDFDWKYLSSDEKASLEFMKSFDRKDQQNLGYYNDFIYKSMNCDRLVDTGLEEVRSLKNGKSRKVKVRGTLKQRIIVTYSRKMAEYQRNVRNRQIQKAEEYLKCTDPDEIKRNQNDFRRFIKKTGGSKGSYELDLTKIGEEEKYDGYYALATNIFDESAKDIIEVSSRRYKIEDCFRVLKTYFDGRPVHHRKEVKIKVHFLICFTALLIQRLIEAKLDDHDHHFSTGKIIENLRNMNVLSVEDAYYQAAYSGSQCLSALEEIFNLELDRKYYLPKQLNKLSKIK